MKLPTYLEKNNLSYAKFAKTIGMDSTSAAMNIWRYCNTQRRPRPEIASKIVSATKGKVTFEDIYGGA